MSDSHYKIRIPKPTRRWVQLGLGAFLILWLIIGALVGLLGKRIVNQPAAPYAKSYYVTDIVAPPSTGNASVASVTFTQLITSITTQVAPSTWTVNGGQGTVESFPTNFSLVISQTDDVHKEVAKHLDKQRTAILAQPTQ